MIFGTALEEPISDGFQCQSSISGNSVQATKELNHHCRGLRCLRDLSNQRLGGDRRLEYRIETGGERMGSIAQANERNGRQRLQAHVLGAALQINETQRLLGLGNVPGPRAPQQTRRIDEQGLYLLKNRCIHSRMIRGCIQSLYCSRRPSCPHPHDPSGRSGIHAPAGL